MIVIAGCRVMDVMGGITTTLSALPNRVLDTVGVLALTVAARRALFDVKFSAWGMYSPIWDVSGASVGAGWDAI